MCLWRSWQCTFLVAAGLLLDLAVLHGRAAASAEAESNDAATGSCAAGGEGGSDCRRSAGTSTGSSANTGDFFRSYGTAWVQTEMLQDEVRTNAFRDAIVKNRRLFKGKVVLDVGAGTGILSFFAARAGAAKVYAVEKSDMALIASQIAVDNNLTGVVQVIHGLMEEVELPVPSVDIIISEWIGTFLIHESMLDSVLLARDRWLAPNGFLLPDHATLYIAAAEDQAQDFDSWDKFQGFNFSALAAASRKVAAQQCLFRNSLATKPAVLLELDLYKMTVREQEFDVRPRLPSLGSQTREVHGLAAWFTLDFFSANRSTCADCRPPKRSQMTTHPDETCTHWQQTLFSLATTVSLPADASLDVLIRVRRASWSSRDLSIQVALDASVPESAETFFIVGADL